MQAITDGGSTVSEQTAVAVTPRLSDFGPKVVTTVTAPETRRIPDRNKALSVSGPFAMQSLLAGNSLFRSL
jgi:hypothetical protein